MATYHITTLNEKQAAWCKANGIRFDYMPKYRLSVFSKGSLSIETIAFESKYPQAMWQVTRRPTVELDGPDCNDGENVVFAEFAHLKDALACLAGAS